MSQKNKTNSPVDEAPASIPEITPPGLGHPLHNFMQTSMELQKGITEVKTNLDSLIKTVDGVKTKVDDLVKWKHLIVGGVFAVGLVIGGVGWIYKMFHDDYQLVQKSELEEKEKVKELKAELDQLKTQNQKKSK